MLLRIVTIITTGIDTTERETTWIMNSEKTQLFHLVLMTAVQKSVIACAVDVWMFLVLGNLSKGVSSAKWKCTAQNATPSLKKNIKELINWDQRFFLGYSEGLF